MVRRVGPDDSVLRSLSERLVAMEDQCAAAQGHLQNLHERVQVERTPQPDGHDIEYNGVEVVLPANVGQHQVQSAALYIRDAIDGAHRVHPREGPTYREAYLYHLKVVCWLPFWSLLPLILHFFERPLWCSRWMANPTLAKRISEPCANEWYPSYPVEYLPLKWNFVVELVLLIPLAGHSLLLWYAHGQNFWKRWYHTARVVVIIAYVLDMIFAYSTPQTVLRLAPYLRVGFVVLYSNQTRMRLQLVLRTLPEVLSIFTVILGVLTFSSWVGILLFPNQDPTSEGIEYFKNLGLGMWSLYILMTTANFPDVMMPAYSENRWAVIFFALFCIVSCFFLMNILTAVVFNEFGEQRRELFKEKRKNYAESFRQAFDVLSSGEGKNASVSKECILAVFEEFNYYQDIEYIEVGEAAKKFEELDKDNSDNLTWDEFRELGRELAKDITEEKAHQTPVLERIFPWLKSDARWRKLGQLLMGGHFDMLVDIVLVFNGVLLIVETWGAIEGDDQEDDTKDAQKGSVVEGIITFFYFFEAMLKILVAGWFNYIKVPRNRFDFIVTACTTATAIYVWLPNEFNSLTLVRYISMLRLLRILRLLLLLGPFRLVAGTFIVMLPQAVALGKVLCVVMYVFAAIGCQFFGGVINKDPESVYGQRLNGSDFAEADYYANNFNDMFSAMAVLFELLVVNNWFVLAGGFADACDSIWAHSFFVIFHVIGVCCCLNIVVAFIIDAFLEEYDKSKEEPEDAQHPVAAVHQSVIGRLQDKLPDEHRTSGRESRHSEFLQVLVSKQLSKEPDVQDLTRAFEEAIPYAFHASIRLHPGFEEGVAVLASLTESLVQHSLEKDAEEAAPMDLEGELLED